MKLRFSKMHGLGNDFVIIDCVSQRVNITPQKAKKLADRNFGVGCDQVLIVEPPRSADADFRYRIFNHDGSEVENCGNGARCFAVFVRQRGLTAKCDLTVQTAGGDIQLHVRDDNQVTVNMGVPVLSPADIPFVADRQTINYSLLVEQTNFDISAVSMGNPHCVTLVDDVDNFAVPHFGPLIECHSRFPNKTNASFMQIISPTEAKLRVFERGVGETLACGTGACAAMVSARLRGLLDERADMHLPGGTLALEWEGEGKAVMMTGPATSVFQGQMNV
ncbi:MAG: diaminopimelate epimerase [Lentisphaeria bacterium]